MAIFGNITERYESYQLDYAINEVANFRSVVETVNSDYLTEGFFSNLAEKVKNLWTKFKNWVKEKIKWIKDKIRSFFGKKPKKEVSRQRVANDKDVDLTLKTSYFSALDQMVADFDSGNHKLSDFFGEIKDGMFDSDDYQEKIGSFKQHIQEEETKRREELNKAIADTDEAKLIKVQEVTVTSKRLSSFVTDLREIERNLASEMDEIGRLERVVSTSERELRSYLDKTDDKVVELNTKRDESGDAKEREIYNIKSTALYSDVLTNRLFLNLFLKISGALITYASRNAMLYDTILDLDARACVRGIEQQDIDNKNLENYCSITKAQEGNEHQ